MDAAAAVAVATPADRLCVTLAEVVLSDMPVAIEVPGIAEPSEQATIRPRVAGEVVEIGFKEGDDVKAGQLLFRLDDALAKARLRQAEAKIAADNAAMADARIKLNRAERLARKDLVTEAAMETAKVAVAQLEASIATSLADVDMTKTELEYLTIRAPISGRTGIIGASRGAIVGPGDQTPLVVINQIDPISVGFSVPQQEIGALRKALERKAEVAIIVPGN